MLCGLMTTNRPKSSSPESTWKQRRRESIRHITETMCPRMSFVRYDAGHVMGDINRPDMVWCRRIRGGFDLENSDGLDGTLD